MRLAMMGTGPFAVPTFRGLFEARHDVAALVTQPLSADRERFVPATPMRDVAHEHGVPIVDPDDVNDPALRPRWAALGVELFVVCDYGQILSAETLAAARLGGINLHASLLPRYRGAAPINWALYHGDTETGVSVIHMTPRVDAGPVIAQGSIPIDPDETAVELERRLAEFGSWFVRRAIDSLRSGNLQAVAQDPALASKAPRLKKTDGLVDWSRPAEAIRNQYRAFQPWPRTYAYWHRAKGPPLRLIVGPLRVAPRPADAAPGTVLEADHRRLIVAAGRDAVAIDEVQPAGKRPMAVAEFLRGHRIAPGDRFGPERLDA